MVDNNSSLQGGFIINPKSDSGLMENDTDGFISERYHYATTQQAKEGATLSLPDIN